MTKGAICLIPPTPPFWITDVLLYPKIQSSTFLTVYLNIILHQFHRLLIFCLNFSYFMHYQHTGIPCFPKVDVLPFHFYERPMLVPVFVNQKKSEEDFCFYKKNHYCTSNRSFVKVKQHIANLRRLGDTLHFMHFGF